MPEHGESGLELKGQEIESGCGRRAQPAKRVGGKQCARDMMRPVPA
jgi:hypothetical protein